MKRLRTAGCALALVAAACVAALLVAEVLLRIFFPQPLFHDPDAFIPDPVLGARLKPGFKDTIVTTEFTSTWSINKDGHRGPRAGSMGNDTFTIVALGDSFTFGYGVEEEEAWPRRLEGLLNSRPSDDVVEVVNLGVGGYGTWEEVRLLKMEYDRIRPGLVLLAFYVGNDPEDNTREYRRREKSEEGKGGIVAPGPPPRMERLKRWLGSRLHTYSLVSTRGDELLVGLGLRRLVLPFEMDVLRSPTPAPVEQAWEATRQAFEELVLFCSSRSLPLLVVLVPMKHQVEDEVWARILDHYGDLAGEAAFDRELPQERAVEILEGMEVEFLDLAPGLRATHLAAGESLYWPRDQHWRSRGHDAAAELVAGYLLQSGLVP